MHRIRKFRGKDHVRMMRIGSLVFAARVHGNTGAWAMAQGKWADK